MHLNIQSHFVRSANLCILTIPLKIERDESGSFTALQLKTASSVKTLIEFIFKHAAQQMRETYLLCSQQICVSRKTHLIPNETDFSMRGDVGAGNGCRANKTVDCV